MCECVCLWVSVYREWEANEEQTWILDTYVSLYLCMNIHHKLIDVKVRSFLKILFWTYQHWNTFKELTRLKVQWVDTHPYYWGRSVLTDNLPEFLCFRDSVTVTRTPRRPWVRGNQEGESDLGETEVIQ